MTGFCAPFLIGVATGIASAALIALLALALACRSRDSFGEERS